MLDVALPGTEGVHELVRSFAACLASVSETPLPEVPQPRADLAGYDLTLIDAEVLDELVLPDGDKLGYAEARRNVVTRGIDLNALVGRRFRIGDVECLGQRLCEPCAHLERLTSKGVLRGLIHRGGLRADVLTGGQVTTSAVLETVDEG